MALSILIVEDQRIVALDLKARLQEQGFEVVGLAKNSEETLKLLEQQQPGLILMDINLGDKMDGVELCTRILGQYDIPVVYLTAQTDAATFERAKDTCPYGYISKPFTDFDLHAGIELAMQKYEQLAKKNEPAAVDFGQEGAVFLRVNKRFVKVSLDDILYLQAQSNYTSVVTAEKTYMIASTLSEVERNIDPKKFYRIHRSYIININQLSGFEEHRVFINGESIPISKQHRKDFMKRFRLM